MKIISITLLSILLSISIFARPNPFEPTDQFLEQKELIIKQQEEEENIKKEKEEQAKVAKALEAQRKAKELEKRRLEEEKKNQLAMQKEKEDKKALETALIVEKTTPTPYVPTIKENFKVLSFVKIYIINDILTIEVDPKYKLLNQDILKPEKKFLFDFRGNVSFYTIRNTIVSENFDSFAVGTHMEKNFFRVVINLTDKMENYVETIDSEKGIITIKKK